ncbi:hypothetical protein KDM41_14400 [bacterium]|nr:hypothetical protein [bacterium]
MTRIEPGRVTRTVIFLIFSLTAAAAVAAPTSVIVWEPYYPAYDWAFAACPAGDIASHLDIEIKDSSGNPATGLNPRVKFVNSHTGGQSSYSTVYCGGASMWESEYFTLSGTSGTHYLFDFNLRAGNIGSKNTSSAYLQVEWGPGYTNVEQIPVEIASPDTNGDLDVDISDLGDFAAIYQGNAGPARIVDFNFDGVIDIIDLGEFASHYGHECQ